MIKLFQTVLSIAPLSLIHYVYAIQLRGGSRNSSHPPFCDILEMKKGCEKLYVLQFSTEDNVSASDRTRVICRRLYSFKNDSRVNPSALYVYPERQDSFSHYYRGRKMGILKMAKERTGGGEISEMVSRK